MEQQSLSKKFKESSKATLVKDATSNIHATTRPYLGSKLCRQWQTIEKNLVVQFLSKNQGLKLFY